MLLDRNGHHELPPGKLAEVVTYLEMTARPERRPVPARFDLSLVPASRTDLASYRDLFRRVGQDWLWFSRLLMPDHALAAILADPGIEILALARAGVRIGLLELDRRIGEEVELAFFGLVPDAIGTGAGRWLMDRAIELAFATAPRRVWVHTCTLDHPAALGFYLRSGFVPYRRGIEIADDPRTTGHLPRNVAPQIPVIG